MASPRIPKKKFDQWLQLEEERLSLERQARDKGKQAKLLEIEFEATVREHGGRSRELICHGHRLFIVAKKATPAWKTEFVSVAGADRAEEIIQAQPEKERLDIKPVPKKGGG